MRYIGTTPNQYGDTLLTSDANDQINVKVAGAEDFRIAANTLSVLSGTTLNIDSGATIANSGTATGFGSGGVDTSGTPADNQLAIFTDADTVEGDSNLTYDGTDLILAGGNINVDSGQGIDFSATADSTAGMSSEILDNYEEGVWLPTLVGSTSGSYVVYNPEKHLEYVIIGNECFVAGMLAIVGSTGSPVGQLRLSLPVTPANIENYAGAGYIPCVIKNHGGGPFEQCSWYYFEGVAYVTLNETKDDGTINSITAAEIEGPTYNYQVCVNFNYRIT